MIYFHSVFYTKPNLKAIGTQTIQFNSEMNFLHSTQASSLFLQKYNEEILFMVASHSIYKSISLSLNYVAHSSFFMSILTLNDGLTNISL